MAQLTWTKLALFLLMTKGGSSTTTSQNNGTSGTTTVNPTSGGANTTTLNHQPTIAFSDLLRWIIVSVALAALVISVVTICMWARSKGNKTHNSENATEPDDAVPYATVNFTKTSDLTAQVQTTVDGGDEAAAVTYSTVNVSASAPGASADPSDLYATVNKPKRQ